MSDERRICVLDLGDRTKEFCDMLYNTWRTGNNKYKIELYEVATDDEFLKRAYVELVQDDFSEYHAIMLIVHTTNKIYMYRKSSERRPDTPIAMVCNAIAMDYKGSWKVT